MQSSTIQLAVRGKPSAFDLSFNNEMCVVASPGCLTFFLLSGSGSPRHVIHYEQPQQIRQIRYQKLGHLAALRGGVVSLWDPSKSLRPLLGFVQSPGWITDLNWNLSNYNILATCSDSGGGISLWDVRSPSYSTMQLSAGQVTTSVDWCPSNPNLLAACSDSKSVSVWDIRMTIPNTSSGPSTGSKNGSFSTITSTSGEMISCHWTGNEEIMSGKPSGSFPSLVISKDDSSLEWWNISGTRNSSNSTSTTTNQQNITQSSYSSGDSICVAIQRDIDLDSKSMLVPAPHGNGIVVCKRDDNVVVAQSSDSTARNAKRLEGMIGSLKQVSPADAISNSSYLNPAGHKMDITLHGCPNRNRGLGVGLSLQNTFTTPTEDVDHWLTKGQATVLASCSEAILGLKWSGAGRLISPAHAGFELLMLTESAALHVVRVPVTVLASDSNDDESGLFTSQSSTKTPSNLDVRSSDKSTNATPKYSLKKSLYATTGHADHQAHSVRQVAGYNTIPFRAAGGSDVEAPPTGSSSVSTGYESDPAKARAKVDLSSILQWEILGLEERLQAGFLRGLSVSTVDEQARQVTLEVNHPSASSTLPFPSYSATSSSSSGGNMSSSLRRLGMPTQGPDPGPASGIQERPVTLIIYFPSRFPVQGMPSFTVRSTGTTVNTSTLGAELTAAMLLRDSQKPVSCSRYVPGFLLDIASLFLTRVVQMCSPNDPGGFPVPPSSTLLLSRPEGSGDDKAQALGGHNSSSSEPGSAAAFNLAEGAWEDESDKDTDAGAPEAEVIDPLAYVIPCPRSSGASFSALGVLVCFGGASLSLSTQPGHDGSRKKLVPPIPMPYPKTLADLMVAERVWAEQLAQKALEEAEASAFAAVTLEITTTGQRGRTGRERGTGKSKGRRRARQTANGSLFASGSDSGDVSDASDGSSMGSYLDASYPSDGREGGVDDFEQFEDSLFTSAKHLDGVEITPKSFIYSPSTATAAVPQIQGQPYDFGGRKGVTTAKPAQPSSLTLPAASNAVMEGRLSVGGAGLVVTQGPRGRFSFPLEASISSPVASIASPNQKGNAVSNTVALTSASAGVSGGAGAVESIPSSIKMSRSGSDSQLPHNAGQSHVKATASHSPPSYLGGGASLLPLSISNPQDSLEMLGASLDLHQEEMEGNGQVDGHGYEEEEEGDELEEEGAERESIGMSSKPFRIKLYQAADVRAQLLAFHYTLGPLPSGDLEDVSRVWSARASACRQNAAAMSTVDATLQMRHRAQLPETQVQDSHSESRDMPPSPSPIPLSGRVGCHGTVRVVQQLWSLLASSIEVMVSTKRHGCSLDRDRKSEKDAVTSSSSQPGSSSAVASGALSMYDSMPLGDGSAVDWSISVLGRSMICRCINLLKQSGDLQTLATVVCIFGGSDKLVALMAPGSDRQAFPGIVCTFSAEAIEQLLCTYAETLRRWSATLQATEVTKHMRSDHTKHITKRGDAAEGQVSLKEKESTPDKPLTAPTPEWDAGADYVTLVRLGVNCPKCGVSTESGESSCTASDKAEYRESDESRGYPAYTEREIKGRVTKNAAWCTPCKDYALTCSLCQMPIRGAGYFCTFCGHGGHTDHMREWFEQTVECASGCGCRCGELAQLGHSAGVTKSKYAQEWEEGSEHRGGTTGSKTHSASDSLPGSTRHSHEREAAVHERQGSGSDYFHYHSDSSESDDHSTSSSERGEDSFGSEYTSGTDSVGDDEDLQAASRGNQAGLKEGVQRLKERRQDGSKSDFDEGNYPAFGQDWDN